MRRLERKYAPWQDLAVRFFGWRLTGMSPSLSRAKRGGLRFGILRGLVAQGRCCRGFALGYRLSMIVLRMQGRSRASGNGTRCAEFQLLPRIYSVGPRPEATRCHT